MQMCIVNACHGMKDTASAHCCS